MSDHPQRISRRALLRSALISGAGLLAASAVGCGDDDDQMADSPTPTSSSPPSATATPAASVAPTATATPDAGATLSWEEISPNGILPPARRDHSLVTDGGALYLFGGRSGGNNYADLWAYDLSAAEWTELPAAGTPPGRFGHNAAYVESSNEMLVFGGQGSGGFLSDTWAYSVASDQWEERTPAVSPAPRYGAASAYDPEVGLFVSHGFTNKGRFDDTWTFDPATSEWSDVSAAGDRPLARCLVRSVWDPGTQRLFLFGGQSNEFPFLGDLWAFDGTSWSEYPMGLGPTARNLYSMSYAGEGRILLFGGNAEDGPKNDLWLLKAASGAWAEIAVAGDVPSQRHGHDSVWVPGENALYVFGGQPDPQIANDLWRIVIPEDSPAA